MRRSRGLTQTERWELFFFLGLLVLTCVGLSAVTHFDSLPRIFSFAFAPHSQQSPASPNPIPPAQTLPISTPGDEMSAAPLPSIENLLPSFEPDPLPPSAGKSKPRKPPEDLRWYHGTKYRYVKTLRMRVTAYAPDPRCCWPFPGTTTASGLSVKTNRGNLVAADTRLIPLHALVAVPGYSGGAPVPVLDRGGAIKGSRLDVLLPKYEQAKDWGTKILSVKIYMPVDDAGK